MSRPGAEEPAPAEWPCAACSPDGEGSAAGERADRGRRRRQRKSSIRKEESRCRNTVNEYY
eukprot:scaffold172633_cov33-Tisochrysis_lutea.AAC.1